MLLTFILAAALSRPYHHETITSIAKSRHTHVQVAGRIIMVKREADGDVHIRLSDGRGHFIVAEIIPTLQPICDTDSGTLPLETTSKWCGIEIPVVGQAIVVYGIRRFDNEAGHGWSEVHPVERWIPAINLVQK